MEVEGQAQLVVEEVEEAEEVAVAALLPGLQGDDVPVAASLSIYCDEGHDSKRTLTLCISGEQLPCRSQLSRGLYVQKIKFAMKNRNIRASSQALELSQDFIMFAVLNKQKRERNKSGLTKRGASFLMWFFVFPFALQLAESFHFQVAPLFATLTSTLLFCRN